MHSIKTTLLSNPSFLNVFRNARVLLSGTIGAQIIGFGTTTILTRALSLDGFGIYTLVLAFIALLDRFSSFQTWQALIHFGIKAKESKDDSLLATLLCIGLFLDILGGFAGMVLAILAAYYIPSIFGLDSIHIGVIAICSATLCFNWYSSCTALFRIYNRYTPQITYQIINAGLILISCLYLWLSDFHDITHYLLSWIGANIISRLYLLICAIAEMKSHNIFRMELINISQIRHKTPNLFSFMLTTNIDGVIRVLRDCDMFIINSFLGPSSVALYKIARLITKFTSYLIDPIYQTIYPELMSLYEKANNVEFWRLIRYSSITIGSLMTCIVLSFAITGNWALGFAFGAQYQAAYAVTLLCLCANIAWGFAQPLSPAMIAMGKVKSNLLIHTVTTLSYMAMLMVMIPMWGLIGTGIAFFLFFLLWSGATYSVLQRHKELHA